MISTRYFFVQKLTFAIVGIDIMSKTRKHLIKNPIILYSLIAFSGFHLILVIHFASMHLTDFEELTDSFPLLCQLVLCLCKMMIFLRKAKEILPLIQQIHKLNIRGKGEELKIVERENAKDNFLCSLYLRLVITSGSSALLHPILNAIYIYLTRQEVVLQPPNKATYFWNISLLADYSLLYILNIFTVYYVCVVSLAIDTLFSWFVSNVVAQFHIIGYRFKKTALIYNTDRKQIIKSIIKYHCQTLQLAEHLNRVYSEMIFLKFTIVCIEICSLVFRVSRPSDSMGEVAYKCLFLAAVALQLILYCYNGQRVRDESAHVATVIYCTFDWSNVCASYKNLLFVALMRSQKSINIKCAFFEVDLSLYLWVFKTAWSLIAALKTLDENQD
ncbi:odorant receptor 45a-like [Lucilia sericata]|uniref:odorant receptor 45a-like n=1 Tax=Lucilia sericata TaxID=13632 RepID=UPI0018A8528A|nr:odorant receptor 45a-like [Lucilia sericata]